MSFQLFIKENKSRQRSQATVRFIGELYKRRMLTVRILQDCLKKLLAAPTNEQALEDLCVLLTTAGKELEQDTNKLFAERLLEAWRQVGA